VVTDITYLWTAEGWLYPAVILGLCWRFVVRRAMQERRASLWTPSGWPCSAGGLRGGCSIMRIAAASRPAGTTSGSRRNTGSCVTRAVGVTAGTTLCRELLRNAEGRGRPRGRLGDPRGGAHRPVRHLSHTKKARCARLMNVHHFVKLRVSRTTASRRSWKPRITGTAPRITVPRLRGHSRYRLNPIDNFKISLNRTRFPWTPSGLR
jgi:hypothetical protein